MKDNKINVETSIDLTITWKNALPYILILIESHAKKSYFDCGADKSIKECLGELVDQHEQLANYYTKNTSSEGRSK